MLITTNQTIVMVEGEAELISEKEFIDAMKFAHGPIKEMIQLQKDLASQLEISKRPIPEDNVNIDLKDGVLTLVSGKVDNAIKIARLYTGKSNIITMNRGFHGRTLGALSVTSSNLACRMNVSPLMSNVFYCNNFSDFLF